jgi:hypothetical protein
LHSVFHGIRFKVNNEDWLSRGQPFLLYTEPTSDPPAKARSNSKYNSKNQKVAALHHRVRRADFSKNQSSESN